MPKSISAGMRTLLDGDTHTLASCWRVVRIDGTTFYFTDHDEDITFDGNTYNASTGYTRSAIDSSSNLAVDNLDIEGLFDSEQISEQELRAGLFNYAQVFVFAVDWSNADGNGAINLRRGWFGEVGLSSQGYFRVELRGLTQPLSQNIIEVYSPECRADLGDSRCRVPLNPDSVERSTAYTLGAFVSVSAHPNRIFEVTTAGTTSDTAPTFTGTIDGTTADGTVTFTTRQAWSRTATVTAVTDRLNFTVTFDEADVRETDNWFLGGLITWTSGNNDGRKIEIKGFVAATDDVQMYLPQPFDVEVGDTLTLAPGCFKRIQEDCIDKFDNVINFRGEPYVPGQDNVLSYPDAK